MLKRDAVAVAESLGGDAYEIEDDDWAVRIKGHDTRIIVIFDNVIVEYEDEDELKAGSPTTTLAMY